MSDEEIYDQLVKESKDITAEVEIKSQNAEAKPEAPISPEEGTGETEVIPDSDHALTEFLNMAINYTDEHAKQLKQRGIEVPEVNKPLWENFGKPLLNRAFWHYFPESDGMDDPRMALIVGGAMTVMAVAPSLIGIVRYYRAENEKQKRKAATQKQIQKEQIKEVAKEAEKEKQKRIEQAIQESPYLKKVKYEEIVGL